jgi:hypothetical protein
MFKKALSNYLELEIYEFVEKFLYDKFLLIVSLGFNVLIEKTENE